MNRFLNWLDDRTGFRALMHEALYEHIPGGPRWRYVWGSTLSFCFFVQVVTGLILWMAYSPSVQTAWESVYYIQNQMWGGWLLRGMDELKTDVRTIDGQDEVFVTFQKFLPGIAERKPAG